MLRTVKKSVTNSQAFAIHTFKIYNSTLLSSEFASTYCEQLMIPGAAAHGVRNAVYNLLVRFKCQVACCSVIYCW